MKVWRGLAFNMAAAARDADKLLRDQIKHGEPERDREVMHDARKVLLEALYEWDTVTALFNTGADD